MPGKPKGVCVSCVTLTCTEVARKLAQLDQKPTSFTVEMLRAWYMGILAARNGTRCPRKYPERCITADHMAKYGRP